MRNYLFVVLTHTPDVVPRVDDVCVVAAVVVPPAVLVLLRRGESLYRRQRLREPGPQVRLLPLQVLQLGRHGRAALSARLAVRTAEELLQVGPNMSTDER